MTLSKMLYWHQKAKHENQPDCVFCPRDMAKVAEHLTAIGFTIVGSGHAWVTIRAEENIRRADYGLTSDEADKLFRVVSGREWVNPNRAHQEGTAPVEPV